MLYGNEMFTLSLMRCAETIALRVNFERVEREEIESQSAKRQGELAKRSKRRCE